MEKADSGFNKLSQARMLNRMLCYSSLGLLFSTVAAPIVTPVFAGVAIFSGVKSIKLKLTEYKSRSNKTKKDLE